MHNQKMLKAVATSAIGLSLLASTASEALWEQFLPETEIITQFHGDPEDADLRLFMAGNQFVVMDNLIAEFKKQHPKYEEIYYVTIPPGKELRWIQQGGAEWKAADFPNVQELDKVDPTDPSTWIMVTTGAEGAGFKMLNMPDVYTTVARGHMNQLANAGLVNETFTYTHNQLAVMADASQEATLRAIADDDCGTCLFPGEDGTNVDGELTAVGLYRLFASPLVWISEPDIQTQGIERHIWRMYTNVSQAAFDCATSPGQPVCSVVVNDVFPPAPDTCANNATFFSGESDLSLRKIVYQLKRCDEGPYASPSDATTFVTSVHHLETPANIEEGVGISRLTVGPVWGTEVEFQQFRRNNPDIVAIRIDDNAGPDGKALNRSDDVNYLAAEVDRSAGSDKPGLGNKVVARNLKAAKDFLEFLKSPEAQVILERAGFIPATPSELNTTIPLP